VGKEIVQKLLQLCGECGIIHQMVNKNGYFYLQIRMGDSSIVELLKAEARLNSLPLSTFCRMVLTKNVLEKKR